MAENNENKGFLDDFEVDEETLREVELASKRKKPKDRYLPPKKPTYSQVHRSKLRRLKAFVIVSWVLLFVFIGFGAYMVINQVNKIKDEAPLISNGQVASQTDNVVLMSLEDDVTGSWRRTFVLVRFNGNDGSTSVCSLPMGLKCSAGNREATLADHYKYGGILQVKRAVSDSVGIVIDKCFVSKYSQLDKIMEKVGAVEYDVESDMNETSEKGEKFCDLKKGKQSLTSHQIYSFLTYRNGTIGEQSKRNSKLLSAVFKKFYNNDVKENIVGLYQNLVNDIDTDISMSDMNNFVSCFDKMIKGEIHECAINTVGEKSVLDSASIDALVQNFK